MSRSNLDKPFYVDIGTSIVAVRCASNHDVILEYDHGRSPQSQPTIQMAKDICERMNREVEIHNSGDCAKLRETVKETQSAIARCMDILNKIPECRYNVLIDDVADELCDLREECIKDALAAPARNCDFGTAEEQDVRFGEFCLKHIGCAEETGGKHCLGCPLEKATENITQRCELYWAQLPYEEEEGGSR